MTATTKTKTNWFSCDCDAYLDNADCEHARDFIAVMAERHPHIEVVLEPYSVAMERQRAREREQDAQTCWWLRAEHLGALMTAEIEADPEQAAALDRAREQARRGDLISEEEAHRLLEEDENDDA